MKRDTSWNSVAKWYDDLLEQHAGTYQAELLLPNLLRLLGLARPAKGLRILDLACGQGFFARAFAQAGATVVGVDASKRLIDLAKKHATAGSAARGALQFHVARAHALPFVSDHSIDAIVIVLAIQNIENINNVFAECKRVLRPAGKVLLVLNHPAFRIPKASDWQHDAQSHILYRRIAGYLSERKIAIDMHPGKTARATRPQAQDEHAHTVSFHRPLQAYSKALAKSGFVISRLEEWDSHKKSLPGPRKKAEDTARKEIPLFLCIEAAQQSM